MQFSHASGNLMLATLERNGFNTSKSDYRTIQFVFIDVKVLQAAHGRPGWGQATWTRQHFLTLCLHNRLAYRCMTQHHSRQCAPVSSFLEMSMATRLCILAQLAGRVPSRGHAQHIYTIQHVSSTCIAQVASPRRRDKWRPIFHHSPAYVHAQGFARRPKSGQDVDHTCDFGACNVDAS